MPAARIQQGLFTLINATRIATQQTRSKVKAETQQGKGLRPMAVTERQKKNSKQVLKVDLLVDRVGVAPHTPRCRPRSQQPPATQFIKGPVAERKSYPR